MLKEFKKKSSNKKRALETSSDTIMENLLVKCRTYFSYKKFG
jgi:hypothetical protein